MIEPNLYPTHVFLQLLDSDSCEFKEDKCWQSAHDAVMQMQVRDTLRNPVVIDDSELGVRRLDGLYTVEGKQMKMHFDPCGVGATITLFISGPL